MMGCKALRPLLVGIMLCACACTGANPALSSDDKQAMAARKQRALPGLRADGRSPLGTNLAAVRDYETAFPFINLFKQSRAWISNTESTWDDGRPIDVDARGWVRSLMPGQRARSLVIWGEDTRYPAGDYVVRYRGRGIIDAWPQTADEPVTIDGVTRIVVHADPTRGGIAVTLTAVDSTDPIREIEVVRRSVEQEHSPASAPGIFGADFLRALKPFSVLRFMDWLETNESRPLDAAHLPQLADARFTDNGVPAEVIGQLCTAAGTDAWVSVPHLWSDDAVASFAKRLHDSLPATASVYVESSNEVWNGAFPQATWARAEGQKLHLEKDPYAAQLRFHAKRSLAVFAAFDAAFKDSPARVVHVIASHLLEPQASALLLSSPGVAAHADVLAVAGYLGGDLGAPENAAATAASGLDGIFTALNTEAGALVARVRAQRTVADTYGVRLVAYEGGQHLAGQGEVQGRADINALFDAANRDPRMAEVYGALLSAWRAGGGELFVHYTAIQKPSRFGRWGALESASDAASPKADALARFVAATPRFWNPAPSGAATIDTKGTP